MSTDNSIQLPAGVKDETGNPYGKLTVESYVGIRRKLAHWLCRCECGNTAIVAGADLRKKSTVSCGCHRERSGGACSGRKRTPEYTSWTEAKRRCYKDNYPDYHLYGGKGVRVCQRWLHEFANFLKDMGLKPFPSASIDRINGDGNYSCGHCKQCIENGWTENCRWATKMEQSQNTSKTRMLTYNGETYCLREWARRLGITHRTLSARLAKGWPLEKVFSSEHYFTPPPIKKARPKL